MKILKLPVDDRSGFVSIEIGIQRENSLDPPALIPPARGGKLGLLPLDGGGRVGV